MAPRSMNCMLVNKAESVLEVMSSSSGYSYCGAGVALAANCSLEMKYPNPAPLSNETEKLVSSSVDPEQCTEMMAPSLKSNKSEVN